MKIIPLTYEMLFDVLNKKQSFSSATKKYFKQYQLTKVNKVDALVTVSGELRHHLLLSNFVIEKVGELPLEVSSGVCLLLSNKLYTKKFQNNEMEKFVKSLCKDIDEDTIGKIESLYTSTNEISDIKFDKEVKPLKYLSMRFNVPSWVVKLWGNHYDKSVSFKMLKNCRAPMKQFVSFYEDKDINKELYELSSLKNVYKYSGKGNVRNTIEYNSHWLYETNPVFAEIFESVDVEPIKGIAIYNGYQNSLIDELYARYGHNIEVDYIVNGISNVIRAKKEKENKLMNGIHIYDCPYSAITTCVSKKVNTFFILPKSTELNKLHTTVDYFLNVDNTKIDDYILEQKTLLEKASGLVEYSGKIIYVIPTANNKESRLVIEDFLQNHSDFSLVFEKQYLFDEEFDVAYYYAILEKVREDD